VKYSWLPSKASNRCAVGIAVLAFVISCRDRVSTPTEFWIPPGSHDVVVRSQANVTVMELHVAAAYPASSVLSGIGGRLKPAGYVPIHNSIQNPSLASSHVRGWTRFSDATGKEPTVVHQWLGDWRNPAGDIVSVALSYRSSTAQGESAAPISDDLRVAMFLTRAKP
jgi:hypothetical protein